MIHLPLLYYGNIPLMGIQVIDTGAANFIFMLFLIMFCDIYAAVSCKNDSPSFFLLP